MPQGCALQGELPTTEKAASARGRRTPEYRKGWTQSNWEQEFTLLLHGLLPPPHPQVRMTNIYSVLAPGLPGILLVLCTAL